MNVIKEEILRKCSIDVERLKEEKPLLTYNILKAMEIYDIFKNNKEPKFFLIYKDDE